MIKIPFSLDDWELSISKDEATSMNVKILKDLSRGVSLFSRMWNYMRLKFNGVRMGKHCVIHGHVGINVASTAFFSIGDYFYMSNGRHRNPLCGNVEGGFYLENNARVQIGNYVGMSSTVLWASTSITIGSHVNIGANVKIMDTDAHSLDYAKRRNAENDRKARLCAPIVIENDCFIGMNCIILKGVTIGARSVIGAGSVVTKNIPPDSVACGNPARIVKTLK